MEDGLGGAQNKDTNQKSFLMSYFQRGSVKLSTWHTLVPPLEEAWQKYDLNPLSNVLSVFISWIYLRGETAMWCRYPIGIDSVS